MIDLETLRQYQVVAHKTAIYPRRHEPSVLATSGGVIYTILGLCGECSEYYGAIMDEPTNKARIIKEAGDVCWYIVEFLSEIDVPVDVLLTVEVNEAETKCCLFYAGTIAELAKKAIRDKGRIDSKTMVDMIRNIQWLFARLCHDCEVFAAPIEEVMRINNEKLLNRLKNDTLKGSGDDR